MTSNANHQQGKQKKAGPDQERLLGGAYSFIQVLPTNFFGNKVNFKRD